MGGAVITAWKADYAARTVTREEFDKESTRAYLRWNMAELKMHSHQFNRTPKVSQHYSYHSTEREAWWAMASHYQIKLVKCQELCERINAIQIEAWGKWNSMGEK